MTFLRKVITVSLPLALGGTVASCLVPELTIVGGIWGIPVLGFALLVGVIFRIAVYYDPRVEQSPDAKKYAGYVAGSCLGYLAIFSSLGLIFQKGQHIAAILGTIFGILALLSVLAFTDYVWVTNQTPEYPTICHIRRFFLFNSSTLLVIAYFTSQEGMVNVMKPFVIFFAYTNCVYFAAVYCGIFRDRAIFQSNGTIAERLREWIRSKTQPGELFSTVQTVLTLLFLLWLIVEAFYPVPTKYNLVSKGVFAGITAVSYYTATLYDPRKPPETSRLVGRVVGVFAHFAIQIYFEWYNHNITQKSNAYAFEVHSVTLLTVFLLVQLLVLGIIFTEIAQGQFEQYFLPIFFHVLVYTMSTILYLLFVIVDNPPIWKTAMLSLSTMWYYYTTLYLIAAIAGKYREVVRQAPPALNVLVQIPLEVHVEIPDRELPSPPFNRRQSGVVSAAVNV
jgi:hypothetical protein